MNLELYKKADELYREISYLQSLERRIVNSCKLILGMKQTDGLVFYEEMTEYIPTEQILNNIRKDIEEKNREFEKL